MVSYKFMNCKYDAKEQEYVQKLFKFVSNFYSRLGYHVYSDLMVIKDPNHNVPQFCAKARNPGLSADVIFLRTESYNFWCKVAYQLGHEYAHYIMNMNDQDGSFFCTLD